MKTIGIIGGLGPETTSEFYLELIFNCQKNNRKHRPPILIDSVPLPYNIERDAIAKNFGEKRCIPYIVDAAVKLEKAGADFIVMPCNSLHAYISSLRAAVNVPVLSLVEETTTFIKKKRIKKVGIVSTSITRDRRLYEKTFSEHNISYVEPNRFQQKKIDKIIHNLVTNKHTNRDKEELIRIIDDFTKENVKYVILACTDLQLLMPKHKKLRIYDTMKIFAEASVKEILKH